MSSGPVQMLVLYPGGNIRRHVVTMVYNPPVVTMTNYHLVVAMAYFPPVVTMTNYPLVVAMGYYLLVVTMGYYPLVYLVVCVRGCTMVLSVSTRLAVILRRIVMDQKARESAGSLTTPFIQTGRQQQSVSVRYGILGLNKTKF